MKKIIVLVAAVAFSVATFAQARSVNAIHIGGNLSTWKGDDVEDTKFTPGYQVGFTKDFGSLISIEPGIFLIHKGVKFEEGDSKEVYNTNYLQIPINLKLNLELGALRIQAGVGVYGSYGLWGKAKWEEGDNDGDTKIKFKGGDAKDDDDFLRFSPFDFGGQVFAGVHFNRLGLSINYQPGFAEIMKDNKVNNSSICLSLSYQLSDPE
jgi:hypothetical protein